MSVLEWSFATGVGLVLVFLAYVVGRSIGTMRERAAWKETETRWKESEGKIRKESVRQSRAVIRGQVSEQLAPYLPDFPYSPAEARFIGKPIDFLIFEGMDDQNIQSVVFVEVKTGTSRLSSQERRLKEAIENKRVSWFEYRVPVGDRKGIGAGLSRQPVSARNTRRADA